jgi:hypothetical protein
MLMLVTRQQETVGMVRPVSWAARLVCGACLVNVAKSRLRFCQARNLEGALEGTDSGRIRPLPLHFEAIDHVGGTEAALANLLRDQLSKVRAERH